MFKFKTIGAFKQVRNIPDCVAKQNLQMGMVVIPDNSTKEAPVPANATDAKKLEVYVVGNIIDKPEVYNSKTYEVLTGEHVRAFRLADLVGLQVELDYRVLKDAFTAVAKGDVLVPAGDGTGKWVKADGTTIVATDYAINLKIDEKTTFGDKGLLATVVVNG